MIMIMGREQESGTIADDSEAGRADVAHALKV